MSAEQKNNILVQGSILAVASIMVRLIGVVYRIPMNNILGEEGNGIYSVAFNIYNTALIISSYSLPLAVSKLVSARTVKREYKNAYRIFRNAMLFAIISGLLAGLIIFFGAEGFEKLYVKPGLARPLRILAPTLFVVAVLGVLRGLFQGKGTMVPTAFSQILEQIVNAIVSVAAAYFFMSAHSASIEIAAYGAAGGTLGTFSGALMALLVLLLVFALNRPLFKKQMKRDRSRRVESDGRQFAFLIYTIIPVILSQTVYQISTTIDDVLFGNIMNQKGFDNVLITSLQGVYNSQYILLVNVPLSIATAMASSAIPSIVASMEMKNYSMVRNKITSVIKFNMVIAFPSAVGLMVLAKPIMTLLFPSLVTYRDVAANLMFYGSLAIIFFAFSTITSGILQGMNYMSLPVIHNLISLVVHIVLMVVLLNFTELGIYVLVIGNVTFPILVCVLNWIAIKKRLGYRQEIRGTFFVPLIASIIMGAATYGIYKLIYAVIHSNLLCTLISVLAAVVIYGGLILVLRCFKEEEIYDLPLGRTIARVAKKLHLL